MKRENIFPAIALVLAFFTFGLYTYELTRSNIEGTKLIFRLYDRVHLLEEEAHYQCR